MSEVTATTVPDTSVRSGLRRLVGWGVLIVVIGAAAYLLGWNIGDWFSDLWDTITEISVGYLIAACVLKTLQTSLTAFAWYSILHYSYPSARFRLVLACYAISVALNGFLPANLGTLVLLLMFTTLITASFSSVLGAYVVEKIFFTLIGAFTYLYLFLSVAGSFDIKFKFIHSHPWATAILVVGILYLLFAIVRAFWPRIVKWWDEAKEGGAILGEPRKYLIRVFTPSLLAWCASLGVMSVFLAAYDIPVSFDTLMRICGGNSIANVTSVTPGGAGVNQAFNVASLNGVTDATTATAYSVAQQLVTTAWNILFGILMLIWVFGWTGGKDLVESSYADAKVKAAEQKAARAARKEAKRAARHEHA
jgi:uncharacterized membrane protein YbhN (UPF0104 family)